MRSRPPGQAEPMRAKMARTRVMGRGARAIGLTLPLLRGGGAQAGSGLGASVRLVTLLAIVLGIVLPALAAASPPDPTWIPGLYDDADFDDVVTHIGFLAGICDAFGPAALAVDSFVRQLTLPGRRPWLGRSRSTLRGRAPPLV